jgi:hypothetical protein
MYVCVRMCVCMCLYVHVCKYACMYKRTNIMFSALALDFLMTIGLLSQHINEQRTHQNKIELRY